MKSQKILFFFLMISLAIIAFGANRAQAADFDPSYIISDSEITDYNSMNLSDIQKFLNHQNGTLSNYSALDKEGMLKTAAQTFFEVAQHWLINPKYLLLLVQKEESLLTDPTPSQGQYDHATGYGCPDSGGCDDRFRGFYRQVNSAAAQMRYYLDNINEFCYKPNSSYMIDGQEVTIQNTATAGLYNYTPHLHGNLNLWNLWNNYFSRKWPDGTLLQSEDTGQTYLLQNGNRREIISKAIFASRFDPKNIVQVSQTDLDLYNSGPAIKYLNYSLLSNSQGEIYMITDDTKREFSTSSLIKKLGFSADDIIKASDTDLALYADGPAISEYTFYPTGILVSDPRTKGIYYIQSSGKRPVINKEILKAVFPNQPIKKITADELDRYPTGDPVTLPDGWLVRAKSDTAVYVIANGKRLPIYSADTFVKMGYNWKNVKTVSDQTLAVQPLGQTINASW